MVDPFKLIVTEEEDEEELPFTDTESCPMCNGEIEDGYCRVCGWTDGNSEWFDDDEEFLFDEVR